VKYLDQIAPPARNAFHNVYCNTCGAMLGMRAGGGTVTDGETDANIESRIATHVEWHDKLNRLADWAGYAGLAL
jgi:hypothetical protein